MSIRVSVIIPTYNRAELLCRTIDSALAQTFQDFEIIVVDDGSTDDTALRMARYPDKVRYVRQANQGVNAARNHALRLARGEYIATLDNDDLWRPSKLAIQVAILDRFPELALTWSNFSIYRDEGDIIPNGIQTWFAEPKEWGGVFERSVRCNEVLGVAPAEIPAHALLWFGSIYAASLNDYFVLPSSALFRRGMVPEGVQFIEHDPICGDWDFFARLSRDRPVCYLDHDTTFNRSHEDEVRLTRTAWKRQLEMRVDMLERLYLADNDFCLSHRQQVDTVYFKRLRALWRQQMLDDERDAAAATLTKYRRHASSPDVKYLIMLTASFAPGFPQMFQFARRLRS